MVPTAIVTNDGSRYKSTEDWLEDMQRDTAAKASEIASNLLYEAEVYMSVANILAMLKATEMTVGNLKTVQRSYQKILNRFNQAADYIDKKGIRNTYNEFHEKYGLELEFEDVDMDWVDDDGKEVYERLKIRIGNDKKQKER